MNSQLADPASRGAPTGAAIDARGVEKRYGGTMALKGVSVRIDQGTIHALVGENGAGKSTFLGVIAGRVVPSAGEVDIYGAPHVFGQPRHTRQLGIASIYQELTIVPALTARANVFLGRTIAHSGLLAERAMSERYDALCKMLGVTIPGDALAGQLSVADQQMLEIMRGVQSQARLILFDEPTTALAPPERDSLFRIMRQLRAEGRTMMIVSHNLDEVLDIADMVTVFRDGRVIETAPRARWTKAELVRAMIGHDLEEPKRGERRAAGAPLLEARDISKAGAIEGISFKLNAGEILGIGGLVGSGRTSLLRCLAGLEPLSEGSLSIGGKDVRWPRTPRDALAIGIALVPEDRKTQGLILSLPAIENIALTAFRQVSRLGLISQRVMRRKAEDVVGKFGFAPQRLDTIMRDLSGGNQQKILLSKWYYRRPRVLLVDEPTRGIDVGAKEEILRTLRALADEGLSIIVVSSELEEVVAISDRVIVLSEGRKVAELDGVTRPIDVNGILAAAFGVAQ
ncbi:MAG: sugar ABC transporter ATP-binding protein [Rhizobiaceae bacterium]